MQTDLAHALVDLWARRQAPVDYDVPRSLHAARLLEDDPESPRHLLGFAWTVVEEMLRAAGWSVPETEGLVRCRSAAASVSHSTALLLDDVEAAVSGTEAPPVMLGALAASRSLFGRWDLLPARGALLVRLEDDRQQAPLAPAPPGSHGIRWASAGARRRLFEENSRPVQLNGVTVRVPTAVLIAARIPDPPPIDGEMSSFLFCAAAHAAIEADQWKAVRPVAQSIGRAAAVREAEVRHRLEDWLEVHTPPARKFGVRLRQLVRPALAGLHLFT